MRHVLWIDNVYFCHVPLVGYERREYLRSILLKNCVAVKHGDVVENTAKHASNIRNGISFIVAF